MAVTRYSTFDKTVQTIVDRNNISNKVDGMTVVVLDAISDINAGPGKAVYRWESSSASWILVSKEGIDMISFATEELTITNGKVIPSNIVLDNQIWNIDVIEGSLIVAQPRIEDLYIDYTQIAGLTEFNGKKLRFTYAYGSMGVQMSTIIQDLEEKIENFEAGLPIKPDLDALQIDAGTLNGKNSEYFQEKLVSGENVKTINGNSIIGSGNLDVFGNVHSINTSEYETGDKRDSKDIYGIEVPLGNLPNTGSKEVNFFFNPTYMYWIDGAHSYASSPSEVITLPYSGFIGDDVSVKLDKANNKIVIIAAKDRSSFVGNLVLLYTK